METSLDWNIALFHSLNAAALPTPVILWVVEFFAQGTPYLALGILAFVWFFGGPVQRRSLMISGVALALGLTVNFAIAAAIYVPRPFEAGIGHSYLAHTLETSFPSDHATFLWSLGLGLLIAPALRWTGLFIFLVGIATAWARVFLGVHFPLDMLASFAISLLAALTAFAIRGPLDRIFFQPIEKLYLKICTYVFRWPSV